MNVKEVVINDRTIFFIILSYLKLNDRFNICITSRNMYLYFEEFRVQDVSMLDNVNTLFLDNYYHVDDTSMLNI